MAAIRILVFKIFFIGCVTAQDTTVILKDNLVIKGKKEGNCYIGVWDGYDSVNRLNFTIKFNNQCNFYYSKVKNKKSNFLQFGVLSKKLLNGDSILCEIKLSDNKILRHGKQTEYIGDLENYFLSDYKNDTLIGSIVFYKNNSISIISYNENDFQNNKMYVFYPETENIMRISSYNSFRKLKGNQIYFRDNGELSYISFFEKEDLVSNFISFYPSGRFQSIGKFCNIKISYFYGDSVNKPGYYLKKNNGEYIFENADDVFYNNFLEESKFNQIFESYLKDGLWRYYDEKGKLIKREFFDNGKLKKRYFKRFLYFLINEE